MENHNSSYNNADSFAIIFDQAWKESKLKSQDSFTIDEKIKKIIEENKEHPFIKSSPSNAINIAKFRIRLLKLE